jgi:hypothetical protein
MRSNGRVFHAIHSLPSSNALSLRAFANQNAPTKVLPFRGSLCIRHVDF